MSSDAHPASFDDKRLLAECDLKRARRSGPGGQHRNKVETAVIVHHCPTGISAEASERRSQAENRRAALFRLRVNLALAVRCPLEAHAAPSDLWCSRCKGGKIAVNPSRADFPALLAEALDRLAACDFDVKSAAESLGCSSTQLIRFLKNEPRALQQVNEHRKAIDLHPLR